MCKRKEFEAYLRHKGIQVTRTEAGAYSYGAELAWIGWRGAIQAIGGNIDFPESKCQWTRRVHDRENKHIFFSTDHGINQWHPHYMFCPECGREIEYNEAHI